MVRRFRLKLGLRTNSQRNQQPNHVFQHSCLDHRADDDRQPSIPTIKAPLRFQEPLRFRRTRFDNSFEQNGGQIILALVVEPSRLSSTPEHSESLKPACERDNRTMMPDVSFPPIAAVSGLAEVIVDEAPMSGRFNMAMDAAMLELGSTRDVSVIRIYRWREPTVSVGYFQGAGDQHESPFPGLPTVRRLSGGGAILHDLEITYSCTLPAGHPVRQDPSELYGIIHRSLIKLLRECGAKCMLRSDFDANQAAKLRDSEELGKENARSSAEPFLCFLRSNPNDIVHESGIKIVGSAQRRRKGITLQHGSILISASDICPAVEGVQQLSQEFDTTRFSARLPNVIANSVAQRWTIRPYSEEERSVSAEFLSNPTWD